MISQILFFSLQRLYEPKSDLDLLFYDDIVMLNKEQRIRLCAATIPQSKCQLWRKIRTNLITGTKGRLENFFLVLFDLSFTSTKTKYVKLNTKTLIFF